VLWISKLHFGFEQSCFVLGKFGGMLVFFDLDRGLCRVFASPTCGGERGKG
jgi:hypothetical protein